jgi:hypothetical protein
MDMAELVSDRLKCTACGHIHDKPNHCESCGAPVCVKCHATNSMMSLRYWGQFVSDNKPTPYSQMRKKTTTEKKKKTTKPRRNKQEKIADLIKELNM